MKFEEQTSEIGALQITRRGISNGRLLNPATRPKTEKRGLLYELRIALQQNHIRVGKYDVPLTPGMSVRAGIKTDQQRIIDYFLSPLKRYVDESLEERGDNVH